MVFSICCLALSGGASASDIGSYSLVSGFNDRWQVDDVLYDVGNAQVAPGTNPGLSLGSINAYSPRGQYNVFQFVATGKKIVGISAGDIISTKFVNVRQTCIVNKPVATSLSGTVNFTAYWGSVLASTGNSGWLNGLVMAPSSWKYEINQSGTSAIVSGEGSGSYCTFDVSDLKGIYSVTITWTFAVQKGTVPASFDGDTLYLNFRSISSVRTSTPNADAQTQDDILSGINQGNDLQAETNGILSETLDTLVSLPSKIADAITGLFVPSDAQMDDLKTSFNALLSEKMGFVYQAVSLVDGVFDAVFDAVDNPDSDVSFTVPAFPSFDVDGTEVSLWNDPVVVDIADNQVVQTVQQVASPFVVAVMVWGFVHSMEDAFLAFVGGKSLADWVRNRKGDTE